MSQNDFRTDSSLNKSKQFSKRIKILTWFAVVLTGGFFIWGAGFMAIGITKSIWIEIGITRFAWQALGAVSTLCCFIFLMKLALSQQSFSRLISLCVWTIGGLFSAAALLFPRLPDYQSSGFEIISRGDFVLIDGAILLPGLLLVILGSLVDMGFRMQKEIEEIL